MVTSRLPSVAGVSIDNLRINATVGLIGGRNSVLYILAILYDSQMWGSLFISTIKHVSRRRSR